MHNCGNERPILLLMDNHDSHYSYETLQLAKENEVMKIKTYLFGNNYIILNEVHFYPIQVMIPTLQLIYTLLLECVVYSNYVFIGDI